MAGQKLQAQATSLHLPYNCSAALRRIHILFLSVFIFPPVYILPLGLIFIPWILSPQILDSLPHYIFV
jgi:hypothetical protein